MESRRLWLQVQDDLYDVLQIRPEAPAAQIHDAWRTAAKHHHPDLGGDPDRFRKVHLAYLVLSDPAERRSYDQSRRPRDHAVWQQDAPPPAEPDWCRPEPTPYERPALLWLFVVAALIAVLGAYVWPGFTIVTGVAVGVVVLTRYHRMGFGLIRRR